MTTSLVVLLLHVFYPPAIALAVVPVDIDPVNCKPFWSLSHVAQERSEVHPLLADGNSSSSVVSVFVIPGIQASLLHSPPGVVCLGLCHSMLCESICAEFGSKASTAFRFNVFDPGHGDAFCFSTIASAHPIGLPIKRFIEMHSYKSSRTNSRKVGLVVPSGFDATARLGVSRGEVIRADACDAPAVTLTHPLRSSCFIVFASTNNGQLPESHARYVFNSYHVEPSFYAIIACANNNRKALGDVNA